MPQQTQTTREKVRLKLSPQAERYARRDAPRDARLMAARPLFTKLRAWNDWMGWLRWCC